MKELSIGIIGNKINLDPLSGYNFIDFLIIQCMFQTLVRTNESGEIVGSIAKSWTISKDKRTYTFKISDNAKFSNGVNITSEDVIFSLARHFWPESKSIIKNYLLEHIAGLNAELKVNTYPTGIKVINQMEFEIQLNKPYTSFLYILSMPGFSIISSKDMKKSQLVGSGPFIPKVVDNSTQLISNPLYFDKDLQAKKINFSILLNEELASKAIKDKSIDILLNYPYTISNEKNLPDDYFYFATESFVFHHLFYNSKTNIPLSLRKILGLFINNLAQDKLKHDNFYHPLKTFFPLGLMPLSYYKRETEIPNQATLKSELKKYNKLITVLIPKDRTSEVFIDNLKNKLGELSKSIILKLVDVKEYKKLFSDGEYDLGLFAYIGNFNDPDGFLDCLRVNNIPGVNANSKALFDNLSKVKSEANQIKRVKSYITYIRDYEDQWNFIPLYQVKIPFVLSKSISTPKTKFRYETELWNFLWKD